MMRVTDVAEKVGKSKGRITQLCNKGKIVSEGKGKDRRVDLNSALRYFSKLEQQKREEKQKRLGRTAEADAREIDADSKRMDTYK